MNDPIQEHANRCTSIRCSAIEKMAESAIRSYGFRTADPRPIRLVESMDIMSGRIAWHFQVKVGPGEWEDAAI